MDRRYFHADLDAFFASVEQHDNPAYAGKPVIVGAVPGGRGVVSTCSYEARKFGVHSAMPIGRAHSLCPHGIFLPVRMRRYAEVSRIVMGIFGSFTPDVDRLSIDEARLDLTGTERLWGDDETCATSIKAAVLESTGLTISIGVSASRYMAKVASGLRKPDGLVIVPRGGEKDFMRTLPLEKLWGAGEKTRMSLGRAGLDTIAKLQDATNEFLESIFGKAGAAFLKAASHGLDEAAFSDQPGSRSMSGERTFPRDSSDPEHIKNILRLLSDELSSRLWEEQEHSRTIALKIRFSDFETLSRQMKSDFCLASSDEIFKVALRLLEGAWDFKRPVRLIGLGLHDLGESAFQVGLFEEQTPRTEAALRLSKIMEKKGKGRLVRARHLPGGANSPD